MPNRVIRENLLDSEKFNELTPEDQMFFVRLMLVVDDFGKMDARPELLKSKCYPVSGVSPSLVSNMTDTCQSVGLIEVYEVGGKRFLRILNFGQRLRIKRSKYPNPENNDRQTPDMCQSDDGVNPIEVESNRIQGEVKRKPRVDYANRMQKIAEGEELDAS